jgi:adenylate cyclase
MTGHNDSYPLLGAEKTEIRGHPGLVATRIADLILGGRAEADFSDRVRRRIEEQQAVGEIIVGWIQAGAIIFFAVVYAISPKAFPPDTQFEPVPWTLGFYALFTTVRIVLAHRRRLTPAFVMLSVVVDIAVLMITIWSFHLQYRAPPALYLKAPTLMYVFIFIALRTLRLEPRYVLVAGGCSTLGWLALFVFAAGGWHGAVPEITHSYVDYVTSYKILGGAVIEGFVHPGGHRYAGALSFGPASFS